MLFKSQGKNIYILKIIQVNVSLKCQLKGIIFRFSYQQNQIPHMDVVEKPRPSQLKPVRTIQKTSTVHLSLELMRIWRVSLGQIGFPTCAFNIQVAPVYSTIDPEPRFLVKSSDSLSSSHDFEVLKCVVCCTGSRRILTGGKSMTHSDGLSRQFHQTLVQATETAFFWGDNTTY